MNISYFGMTNFSIFLIGKNHINNEIENPRSMNTRVIEKGNSRTKYAIEGRGNRCSTSEKKRNISYVQSQQIEYLRSISSTTN
jgi:hypothetical protein